MVFNAAAECRNKLLFYHHINLSFFFILFTRSRTLDSLSGMLGSTSAHFFPFSSLPQHEDVISPNKKNLMCQICVGMLRFFSLAAPAPIYDVMRTVRSFQKIHRATLIQLAPLQRIFFYAIAWSSYFNRCFNCVIGKQDKDYLKFL